MLPCDVRRHGLPPHQLQDHTLPGTTSREHHVRVLLIALPAGPTGQSQGGSNSTGGGIIWGATELIAGLMAMPADLDALWRLSSGAVAAARSARGMVCRPARDSCALKAAADPAFLAAYMRGCTWPSCKQTDRFKVPEALRHGMQPAQITHLTTQEEIAHLHVKVHGQDFKRAAKDPFTSMG
jgi:hypothetical protein